MEPAINFELAGGVDVARLERSLALKGNRVGEGRYHFSGGAQDHWVDLYSTGHPRCDCGDHLWRERVCKHILAALIRKEMSASCAHSARWSRDCARRGEEAGLAFLPVACAGLLRLSYAPRKAQSRWPVCGSLLFLAAAGFERALSC